MDNTPPTLALLVPVYNGEAFCEPLVRQIEAQPVPFDQVLFYNDGSTDKSLQALQDLGCDVISNTVNGGLSFARNMLLSAQRCDFAKIQDQDDPLQPNLVSKIKSNLGPTPPERTVFIGNFETRRQGGSSRSTAFDAHELAEDPLAFFITHFLQLNAVVYPKSITEIPFRRKLNLYEDKAHLIDVAAAGYQFSLIEEPLGIWRVRPNSTMTSQTWEDASFYLIEMMRRMPSMQTQRQKNALCNYIVQKCWAPLWQNGDLHFVNDMDRVMRDKLGGAQHHTSSEGALFNQLHRRFGLAFALHVKYAYARFRVRIKSQTR